PQAPGPLIGGSDGAIAISSVSAWRQADGCGAAGAAAASASWGSAPGSSCAGWAGCSACGAAGRGASVGRGFGSGTAGRPETASAGGLASAATSASMLKYRSLLTLAFASGFVIYRLNNHLRPVPGTP